MDTFEWNIPLSLNLTLSLSTGQPARSLHEHSCMAFVDIGIFVGSVCRQGRGDICSWVIFVESWAIFVCTWVIDVC